MTNPVGRPPSVKNDPQTRAAAFRQEEEAQLRAMRAHRQQDFDTIRARSAQGMSRRRLVEIYGRDLVELALASPVNKA